MFIHVMHTARKHMQDVYDILIQKNFTSTTTRKVTVTIARKSPKNYLRIIIGRINVFTFLFVGCDMK